MLAACAVIAQQEGAARAARLPVPLGERFGALTLTGAVEWRADRPDFGGFSALVLEGDGAFVALTDKAHWMRATLVLDADGALTGIDGLEVDRLEGPDGTILTYPDTDTEALTRTPDGAWLVGFEGRHRIGRFADLRAPEEALTAVLPGLDTLPLNGSLESVLALPDGRVVALAESEVEGSFPGWIVDGDAVARFTVAKDGWFVPTDLALGPEGAWIYLLERRFTLIGGFGTRVRRFPVAALEDGARIEADLLAGIVRAPLAENYEGLAVTRDAAGGTILYMISDDNFRALQRTLVLQFRVEEGG